MNSEEIALDLSVIEEQGLFFLTPGGATAQNAPPVLAQLRTGPYKSAKEASSPAAQRDFLHHYGEARAQEMARQHQAHWKAQLAALKM
ncbi:hypothetical protein E3E12_02530 [Formicincola oecophyllae]|uniref:Uncharacterized protein n=1 Tax=Formicincola oecophyllae TaxID=2558361 RepID=A0A4Y6U7H1_9PROT|nr:hypothetical protein [Formicincola oecophyllae]QDH13262.1 hypothetical protein E3E12_02530 [Formicincola oecophyllae]